ncbi:hypothetical protein KDA_50930 [Dictyobacter alpinus]|uniref:Photosynthesis system II assembly factor Ycf48/Hcf136-like domain-containing protein n=2 Tax=Dictyobacter alpinus TaxID=2014873 RepID=A0A402BE54_9CHLR|nr:hypothetical protein KDA_50930 [Dictyobacter alpinus]
MRKRIGLFSMLLVALLATFSIVVTSASAAARSGQNMQKERATSAFPAQTFANSTASGIAIISSTDVWVVGSYRDAQLEQHILTEHWNGSAWSVIPSPSVNSSELKAVAAVSSNDVWAVGNTAVTHDDYPTALVEHWNGTQWSVVSNIGLPKGSYGSQLEALAVVSPTNIWAVGTTYINTIVPFQGLIEHWDGKQWSNVPAAANTKVLNGVFALSANNIWAVGSQVVSGHSSRSNTNIIHWDGTQWSNLSAGAFPFIEGELTSITGTGVNNLWAVGYQVAKQAPIIVHWDGSTWSNVDSPSSGNGIQQTLSSITAVAPNDIWAVGASVKNSVSTGLIVHRDGAKWSIVFSPTSVREAPVGSMCSGLIQGKASGCPIGVRRSRSLSPSCMGSPRPARRNAFSRP